MAGLESRRLRLCPIHVRNGVTVTTPPIPASSIDYDFRHILKTDNRPTAVRKDDTENIHIQTFGGYSIHAITTKAGTVDALCWFAGQVGKWGNQPRRAYAFDVEAGFQPGILPKLKPRIRAGYTLGSGDSNPNDSTHGTFFQILPTPRPYARFPFFNMMNAKDAFGTMILRPHTQGHDIGRIPFAPSDQPERPLVFRRRGVPAVDVRLYGPLYFRAPLTRQFDTSAEYRANRHMTFTAYLGYTQGLAAMQQIYPAANGRFGYLEAMFRM